MHKKFGLKIYKMPKMKGNDGFPVAFSVEIWYAVFMKYLQLVFHNS